MGVGWRRWSESLRECVCGIENEFADSAINKRTELRMRGAEAVFLRVVKCEQAVHAAYAAHSDLLTVTEATMKLPLPNPANSSLGADSAASAPNLVGGPDFDADTVGRVKTESGLKLEAQVLAPLKQWLTRHHQLVARYKELKKTRLELVSRRRTVTELSCRVSAMSTRASGSASKSNQQLNAMIRTLSRKETKLTATSQSFEQQESVLSRDLAALIVDGQSLKHHVATALRLQGGALLGAAAAFGATSRVPPPAESAFVLEVGGNAAGCQAVLAPEVVAPAASDAAPQQCRLPRSAAEAVIQQPPAPVPAPESAPPQYPLLQPAAEAVIQQPPTPVPASEAAPSQYSTHTWAAAGPQQPRNPVPLAEAVTQQYPSAQTAADTLIQQYPPPLPAPAPRPYAMPLPAHTFGPSPLCIAGAASNASPVLCGVGDRPSSDSADSTVDDFEAGTLPGTGAGSGSDFWSIFLADFMRVVAKQVGKFLADQLLDALGCTSTEVTE